MKRNEGNIKYIFLRKQTIYDTREKKRQYVCGKQAYVKVNKDNSVVEQILINPYNRKEYQSMQYEHVFLPLNYYAAFHKPVIQVECISGFYTLN